MPLNSEQLAAEKETTSMTDTDTIPESDNSKAGCSRLLSGCFKYGLIAIVLLVVLSLALPSILRSLNIIPPDARVLYGGAPDLAASQDMEDLFLDLNVTGVDVLVLPSQLGGQAAIITMDERQGFGGLGGPGFDQVVKGLVTVNEQGNYDIRAISMIYLDESGNEIFTMATDIQSLSDYSAGRISRSELMGNVGLDAGSFLDALDLSGELGN
jgi:hypothetical protein